MGAAADGPAMAPHGIIIKKPGGIMAMALDCNVILAPYGIIVSAADSPFHDVSPGWHHGLEPV